MSPPLPPTQGSPLVLQGEKTVLVVSDHRNGFNVICRSEEFGHYDSFQEAYDAATNLAKTREAGSLQSYDSLHNLSNFPNGELGELSRIFLIMIWLTVPIMLAWPFLKDFLTRMGIVALLFHVLNSAFS